MKRQHNKIVRTFFHSVLWAVLTAFSLIIAGHIRWGAGFAIGALLSLFSLFSLKVCVPALFHKGASRSATLLLHVALILKLPIYAVGLYLATRMGTAAAFSAFVGCTLVPFTITLETGLHALIQSNKQWKTALALRELAAPLPIVQELSRQVAEMKAESRETMTVAGPSRTVREGAA